MQTCRQATAYGLSPGRCRGLAGLIQGSLGSLLLQDPLWVLLEDQFRQGGVGASAFGVPVPPMGYSDDWLLALAGDASLGPTVGVFGAACQDLGISCKPSALRLFLRRSTGPAEVLPRLSAWDPFVGGPVEFPLLPRGDSEASSHLGVPRAPALSVAPSCARVQAKLELGASTLAGFSLAWDELGPAAQALLGGVANYAPLDSQLSLRWLHSLDVALAALPRRSLRLGISTRQYFYLRPDEGGLALPCAVLEFGLIPWVRELLCQMNDEGTWGALARGQWERVRVRAPQSSHIGRLAAALGGYGVFIRDQARKSSARVLDWSAEHLLRVTAALPPAVPSLPWDGARHGAWAAFAMGSALDAALDIHTPELLPLVAVAPPPGEPPPLPPIWADAADDLRPLLEDLPLAALTSWSPALLHQAFLATWVEAWRDARASPWRWVAPAFPAWARGVSRRSYTRGLLRPVPSPARSPPRWMRRFPNRPLHTLSC